MTRAQAHPGRRARAFTLLETVLAMSIAGLLLVTSLGLFAVMRRADDSLHARFNSTAELARAQGALRRAAQSLVAYPPTPDESGNLPRTRRTGQTRTFDSVAEETTPFESGARPPRLRLGMLDPAAPPDRNAPRRLEVVLTTTPIASSGDSGRPVRGAFDLIPWIDNGSTVGARRGQRLWALIWTPIDPPGEQVLLADTLELAEFAILDADGFHDFYTAHEPHQFPWAIRVVLWTLGGARADWMLEPGVRISPEAQW